MISFSTIFFLNFAIDIINAQIQYCSYNKTNYELVDSIIPLMRLGEINVQFVVVRKGKKNTRTH